MGNARIQIVSVNVIQAEPTARIEMLSVNVLFVETPIWETFISGVTEVSGTLTVAASPWPALVGRWTWPVRERLGFFTQILQSHDRTEQRIAHRCDSSGNAIPTQSFGTQVAVWGEDGVAKLEAVLHGYLKDCWRVPIWPMAQAHTASLPAGSGSIAVDTRYCDYRADGYAIIWQGESDYEVVTVDSVADDALTLAANTTKGFVGHKWIMPCRLGWIVTAGPLQRFHGGALIDLEWEVEDVAAVTGYTADLEYDGMTVLTEPAYWPGEAGEASHDPDITVIGGDTGPFEVISNSDYNEVVQSHVWHPQTMEACWKLRQFLHDKRGRQEAFLVPTFRGDFQLTRPVGAADTSIYVANRGYTANMGTNALRTYLAFRPAGSAFVVRKVTAVSAVNAAEEKIDLAAAPGVAAAMGQTLCWVDKCRLASDTITIDWHRRSACACTVQLARVT